MSDEPSGASIKKDDPSHTSRDPGEIYIDILKFNYEQLHESMWENHKVSWVVTSIFIPLLFTMQGYFIKEYDSIFENEPFRAILAVFVIQYLAIAWWLMMQLFRKYNRVRRDRLKIIESTLFDISKKKHICKDISPIKQYGLHYGVIGSCGIKISFNRIYTLILFETFIFSTFFVYSAIKMLLES
jgi:hypothetical protein